MKNKFPHHPIRRLLLPIVALGLFSATAQAQTQSDVSGAITTTSDLAGFNFSPGINSSTYTTYTSPAVRATVEQIAAALSEQLAGGGLAVAATDIPGTSIPRSVQRALQDLLTADANAAEVSSQFEQALINAPGAANTAENTTLVRNLTSKLQGLIVDSRVEALQLRAAVEAYNAVIDASSGETLGSPPPELLAIRAVLSRLVAAASEERK